ncbi:PAS domain-containing protein [Demequina sp. TTPB684]|uniref:PAS domain-containing protein n=1 Tax=unclassified Demequina TaxID=2620311 RepID=UPI001CF520C5|nr:MULTISPECIES: PAS domain-containing protein [unclassified Demequina]MCB2414093.1 PAS domain-containing protein [Demequina sp. TTPB684]UPU89196.1 PAS domain-containing protein [Demequina sp. TMPB413]
MASRGVQPTGECRQYTPDQVFFSTTDKRGTIVTVNSTFVELSRYAEEELVGSPHNLIRHPDMPGGVFHIMWERLHAGLSMMGYVQNLAKDGAYYLTFSTVTPLSEGYISVRSAISRPDLWEPIAHAYARTRALENSWRESGMSKAEAASRGATELGQRLAAMGYESYDDVVRAIVPAEVDRRRTLAPPTAPVTEPGQLLHDVVQAIGAVDRELANLRTRYDDATAVAASLDRAQAAFALTLVGLEEAAAAADTAAATVAAEAPAAAKTAHAALSLAAAARANLGPLSRLLADVRAVVLDLRASLALSVLHNDMAMGFASEVAAGSSVGDPQGTVVLLGETVATSVRGGETLGRRVQEELGQVVAAISSARESLEEFQRMLTNWRHVIVRSGVSARLTGLLGPIDARLSLGLTELRDLDELASRCETLSRTLEAQQLLDAADALVIAARRL